MKPIVYSTALAICSLFLSSFSLAEETLTKANYEINVSGQKRQLKVSSTEVSLKQKGKAREIRILAQGGIEKELKNLRSKNAASSEVELIVTEIKKAAKSNADKEPRRHFVTKEILVRLKEGFSGRAVAKAAGLRFTHQPEYAPGLLIFNATTSEGALLGMQKLRAMPEVESADVILASQREKKWIPNDPMFSQQWHHKNTTQLGGALWMDTGITSVWDNFKGAGVTIAIIDDGVQHTHPDILANYNTAIDFDFNDNDNDATPNTLTNDAHGTACAGVAGAIGNNSIGVCGAAPSSTITGFRLLGGAFSDTDEGNAFNLNNDRIHIKSNSWGPTDGYGYSAPGELAKAALENAVTTGRGGRGVIQLFAAGNGNGGEYNDNSNYDGYANSPYIIAVAAMNHLGFQSYYSESGANILVSAPSNSNSIHQGIRTTDLAGSPGYTSGDYTSSFGGTSSACPLAAGIVALMLEANLNLGWRDVKEILIRSARKPQQTDLDWKTNGAGFSFNHKYGAGLIDAAAAVGLAQQWINLPAMITTQASASSLPFNIPDNDNTGISRNINIAAADFRVEHVTVTVNATHYEPGDLEVTLTSPSGMVSKLALAHPEPYNQNLNWTYSSVFHWGESGAGNWTVKVADRLNTNVGTLDGVTLKLMGTNQTPGISITNATLVSESLTPNNSAADPGEMLTFSLSLKNNNNTATPSLSATLLPIGGVLMPSAPQNYGVINAGTSTSRNFSFKLQGGCGVAIPLILKLHAGSNHLSFANLAIHLGTSSNPTFTGGSITILDNNTASPSPANLSVSGITGRVQNVTTEIRGLTHTNVDNIGIMLRGANSLHMNVFSGGVKAPISSLDLKFDDNATIPLPTEGNLSSGTYIPSLTSQAASERIFSNNPIKLYNMNHTPFRGADPNGTWQLYVQDHASGDTGSISSWRINFTSVTCVDNIHFTTTAQNSVEESGAILVSVTRSGGREGLATINYATGTGGSATAGSDYTNTSGTLTFAAGELVKTFTIPIINDSIYDTNETIAVALSSAGGNSTLGSSANHTVTIGDGDTDGDGLANDYETSFGLNPAINDANLDLDGDGYNNSAEFVMGTLPNNGSSSFKTTTSLASTNATVKFPSVTGRSYRVEASNSLQQNSWTVVQDNISGTGGEITVTDSSASSSPRRFYRVAVSLAN